MVWLIKPINRLLWSAFCFALPPDENAPDELAIYNQRALW